MALTWSAALSQTISRRTSARIPLDKLDYMIQLETHRRDYIGGGIRSGSGSRSATMPQQRLGSVALLDVGGGGVDQQQVSVGHRRT